MNTSLILSLIPLFPLLGSVAAFVNGKKNPDSAGPIATVAAGLSFLCVVVLFFSLPHDGAITADLFTWFAVPLVEKLVRFDFLFRFDQLTAVMGLVVTGIGTLIHLYSCGYMSEDPSRHRFFSYLNLFLFSMLLLILGGNLLVLFVGWEGVGLCSYLLIGFWFKNLSYAAAGRKAFVVNRIGDAGFLIGMFLLIQHVGSVDFVDLKNFFAVNSLSVSVVSFICFALFIGATGKSAQIPLFVWLPDAMAGPTPVSALIHAATMVTAGVYMMARLNFMFDLAPAVLAIVCVIALLTAFIAATIALTQNDIKKVLAYSTVSQLGFMFLAASVGAYWVAVFHLVTHAFFKACLFLGAGSVIHGCHHEQDMRHMGGLKSLMPITFVTYLISTLAIAGIFPFAGYQSKHAILYAIKDTHNIYLQPYASTIYLIASITALLTAFYMTRSVALTFFGKYRGHAHPHESPITMTLPLIILSILALGGGIYLGMHLSHFLAPVIPEHGAHHAESIIDSIKGSWVGLLGMGAAFFLYLVLPKIPGNVFKLSGPLGKISQGKYFIDEIYNLLIIAPLERLSKFLWKVFDQGIVDGTVNGTASLIDATGEVMRGLQTGQIRHYAVLMFSGALFVIIFYLVL